AAKPSSGLLVRLARLVLLVRPGLFVIIRRSGARRRRVLDQLHRGVEVFLGRNQKFRGNDFRPHIGLAPPEKPDDGLLLSLEVLGELRPGVIKTRETMAHTGALDENQEQQAGGRDGGADAQNQAAAVPEKAADPEARSEDRLEKGLGARDVAHQARGNVDKL